MNNSRVRRNRAVAGGKVKEVDVSRLALFFAFAFIGLVLLVVTGLFIEAFLKMPNAADWASAIGGISAVVAASIIAIQQSRQARRVSAEQARLNAENLSSQIRLQRASFAFQKSVMKQQLDQSRRSAVGVLEAAYDMMSAIVKNVPDDGPTPGYISVWKDDADLSVQLCKSVQYGHLTESGDIETFGRILIDLNDAWLMIKAASTAKSETQKHHFRALAKGKLRRCSSRLTDLNPGWKEYFPEKLSLTEAEREQRPEMAKSWPEIDQPV